MKTNLIRTNRGALVYETPKMRRENRIEEMKSLAVCAAFGLAVAIIFVAGMAQKGILW